MASATFTINGVGGGGSNTVPVAAADTILVTEFTTAVIPVEWLLQNDTDAEGNALTVTAVAVVATAPPGFEADWTVNDSNLLIDGTFSVTTPGATGTSLVLEYTLSDGTTSTTGMATINLKAPSTAGGDNIDITAEVYDFSFIEGKGGNDNLAGSTSDDLLFAGNQDGSDPGSTTNMVAGDATVFFVPVTFSTGVVFTGGDDVIIGGDDANNHFFGDARFVSFTDGGGDDGEMFIGGDDTLIGGDNVSGGSVTNNLVGDAQSVQHDGIFQGGDDVLVGGDNVSGGSVTNNMVGDVSSGSGTALTGGNDTLISGENARDNMTGDFGAGVGGASEIGGADTFVFGVDNGADKITDFRSADGDKINLFDTGLTVFGDLAGHITDNGTDTIIDLGQAIDGAATAGIHTITVEGATGATALVAGDFEFGDWMA